MRGQLEDITHEVYFFTSPLEFLDLHKISIVQGERRR